MNSLPVLLAAISGQVVLTVVIWLVVAGLIYFILDWAITAIGIPEPFNKVARVILILAAVIIVINALLMLVGSPFIVFT